MFKHNLCGTFIVLCLTFATLTSATSTEAKTNAFARTSSLAGQTLEKYMQFCKGTWVGGGLIHLSEPEEFKKNRKIVEPNGFEEGSEEDWTLPADFRRFYMHETIQYWNLAETNRFVNTEFIGMGYAKLVKRAKLNDDNTLPKDKKGNPEFKPDNTKDPVH